MSLRPEGFESHLPSEITSAQVIEQIPEDIRKKLYTASLGLKEGDPYKLVLEADRLVQSGVLSKSDYNEGAGRDVNYRVENPNRGENSYRVLSLHYSPDFHTGRGEKFVSYDQTLYNERGLAVESFTKAREGGISESTNFQYHANNKLQRREYNDFKYNKHFQVIDEFDDVGRPVSSVRKDNKNNWLLRLERYEYPADSNSRFPCTEHSENHSDQSGKLVSKDERLYSDRDTHTDTTQFFRGDGTLENTTIRYYIEKYKLDKQTVQIFDEKGNLIET